MPARGLSTRIALPASMNGRAVDDPRVEIRVEDVAHTLASHPNRFHLVLLDVDNGPGWLASPANAALYSGSGLELALGALQRPGVLALWSPERNRELEAGLERAAPERWRFRTTADRALLEGEPASTIYLVTT